MNAKREKVSKNAIQIGRAHILIAEMPHSMFILLSAFY